MVLGLVGRGRLFTTADRVAKGSPDWHVEKRERGRHRWSRYWDQMDFSLDEIIMKYPFQIPRDTRQRDTNPTMDLQCFR